jgi:putative ABC transport system substrate-binding protein
MGMALREGDMAIYIRRRELIAALGSVAVSWPLAARAQFGERMRRVGAMMLLAENDPEQKAWTEAFREGMLEAGWTDGRNVQIDYRWGASESARARRYAAELVALGLDVILAPGSVSVGPLLQATRDIPIVFVHVPDPVGAGFVESLSRPGGNATGFTSFEYSLGGKWLELLKEITPRVTRVAIIRDPTVTTGIGMWGAIQALAPSVGMEAVPVNVRNPAEIEHAVAAFARSSDGGLIVTGSAQAVRHRDLIVGLATRYKLPAVYYEHVFVHDGGLITYGPDLVDQYRRSAGYVGRILKGEKPADLPVQAPTKFELAVNLKTAKALGLDVPATLLARATEVIE